MKLKSKIVTVCFSFFSLTVFERFHTGMNYPLVYADDTVDSSTEVEKIESDAVTSEDSNQAPVDDYMIPKTVYVGVDSIAAPEELPDTAALPEPTEPAEVIVEELSTESSLTAQTSKPIVETENNDTASVKSTEILAPADGTELPEKNNESADPQTAVVSAADKSAKTTEPAAVVKTEKTEKAAVVKAPKLKSINSVAKRITLFESIDLSSELDVPSGLPEEINQDSDIDEDLSSISAAVDETENKTDEITEQLNSDEQLIVDEKADEIMKPAVVVNIDDNLQIDSQNEWGWTKLMGAAIEGDIEKVSELLNKGANPNIAGEDGRSPLMAASWNKHYEVVEALIIAGADVNLINRDGWTALSFAAWNGDEVIVNSLLRVAANKFIKTADGFTPLQLAQQKGHREIVELLQ